MSALKKALAQHTPDGELYIIAYQADWDGEGHKIVGTHIVAGAGPLHRRDLGIDGGPLEPSKELFNRIDQYELSRDDEEVDWLQDEDMAGRLAYPIGVR